MPKIVDHDLYRKELLGKCFELFAKKGYASVTMRQIAEELQVSTGTLYHYFPNKESLFEQLVEYLSYQDTSEQNLELLGNPPTLSARIEALFNFVANNQDYFLKQNFIMMDFYRQQEGKDFYKSDGFKRITERYEQAFMNFLVIQDKTTIDIVQCLINGLIMQQVFEGDIQDFSKPAKMLAEMLTNYLEMKKQRK